MAQLLLANPRKRRKKRKSGRRKAPSRRVASVTTKSVTRRYRRNPIKKQTIKDMATNSLIGGFGAVATDIVTRRLPLPATMKTGWGASVTKAGVAIGLGYITERFLKQKKLGRNLVEGSLAVNGYMIAKNLMNRFAPGLGEGGDLLAYDDGMGAYVNGMYDPMTESFDEGMGAYVGDSYDFEAADFFDASGGDDMMSGMGDWNNPGALAAVDDDGFDELL